MMGRVLSAIRLQCAVVLLAWLAAIIPGASAVETDDAALKAADGERLADGLWVLRGAVNTGVLVHEGKALLFDACDSVTPERLATLGVKTVEAVYFTQFRRPNTAGEYALAGKGAALYAPAGERDSFEKADQYWADDKNHWYLYRFRPGIQVPVRSVALAGVMRGGDRFEWNGHAVSVLNTPGMTDGAVSYQVEAGGKSWLFCGDVMSGPGQVWELYSLQKAVGTWNEYVGFLGGSALLRDSLGRIREAAPFEIIPSHGAPFPFSNDAVDLLLRRLEELWLNYVSVAGLNFFNANLPECLATEQAQMPPSPIMPLPDWVRRTGGPCFVVASQTGHALLIDFGDNPIPGVLDARKEAREPQDMFVDACWVTHYHEDHTRLLYLLAPLGIPIFCDASTAYIVEHPERYLLPCLTEHPASVARIMNEGETWKWNEFTLTAFHFPGQTLYHGGLLLEGNGKKVFFAGDSVSPKGLHDQTPANRVFLGPGLGLRRCIDVLRRVQPDCILTQHLPISFSFTADQLDHMESTLVKRQELIEAMTPWENANFALDEHWVRSAPYEQEVAPGQTFVLEVEFTNHGNQEATATAEAVLPPGWRTLGLSTLKTVVPAKTSGMRLPSDTNPDGHLVICVTCPPDALPGLQIIPVRIWWDGRYLGQRVTAMVHVSGKELEFTPLAVILGMFLLAAALYKAVSILATFLIKRMTAALKR
jgi:glyoxylase-like metal-dependent hydrolase (beta-lactamase superfamily II)